MIFLVVMVTASISEHRFCATCSRPSAHLILSVSLGDGLRVWQEYAQYLVRTGFGHHYAGGPQPLGDAGTRRLLLQAKQSEQRQEHQSVYGGQREGKHQAKAL